MGLVAKPLGCHYSFFFFGTDETEHFIAEKPISEAKQKGQKTPPKPDSTETQERNKHTPQLTRGLTYLESEISKCFSVTT